MLVQQQAIILSLKCQDQIHWFQLQTACMSCSHVEISQFQLDLQILCKSFTEAKFGKIWDKPAKVGAELSYSLTCTQMHNTINSCMYRCYTLMQ